MVEGIASALRTVKHHEDRRREIIQAAKDLFIKYGTEETSISQIIREVGVAHGLFYYYFKSKEEVMGAVVQSMSDDFHRELLEQIRLREGNFRACIATMVDAIDRACLDTGDGWDAKGQLLIQYYERVTEALHQVAAMVWKTAVESGALNTEDSEQALQIILSGSLCLVRKNMVTREMLPGLIFQMLRISNEDGHESVKHSVSPGDQ